MNIGQLAREAGVPIDTVRYYERNGLLPVPARRASGYRDYQESDVERVRFIRRAKTLGFNLGEVRELLTLSDARSERGSPDLKALASAQLAQIETRLAQLGRLRTALQRMADAHESAPLPAGNRLFQALTDPEP
jgi:DNA-binding transcriptional MerR regulator